MPLRRQLPRCDAILQRFGQLSGRAHGITGTTLRRHLAALVEAGLISRKDSANGKRYPCKDRQGGIENFADACASLWIDGELVHLEDIVLYDAFRLGADME